MPMLMILMVIFAEVAVNSIPNPRNRRRKKLHSSRLPNLRRLQLKVNNFSRTNLQLNNPTNQRTITLWFRNRFFLQVNEKDTPIGGVRQSARAYFEFQAVDTSIVRLKNISTKRYLAINQHGRLKLKLNPDDDCLFKEFAEENSYYSLASHKYYMKRKHDIFIGIKWNGHIRPPRTTMPGLKAVQFMHILNGTNRRRQG